MSYIDAALAPETNTGQVKLHGPKPLKACASPDSWRRNASTCWREYARPGITTEELDRRALEFALDHDTVPAPFNYRGYPKAICTSINHVVCHGIPGDKPMKEGDILNIDVTLIAGGWHGDTSRMFPIGEVSRKAERLIEVTYESLMRGIAAVKPGATTGDIGAAIQQYAEGERTSVVRDFCGHGLGRVFHDVPNILHYGRPAKAWSSRPACSSPSSR